MLDERAKHQMGDNPASLADLYDPLTMPPALLKAHQKLDAAVDKAYEASGGKKGVQIRRRTRRLPLRPVPATDEFAASGCRKT